jgi:hypothetical protein
MNHIPSQNLGRSLEDIYHFLHNTELNHDQLNDLRREIDHLYSFQVNKFMQTISTDLWQFIFSKLETRNQYRQTEVSFWLESRTVSKSWYAALSKLDLSPLVGKYIPHTYNLPRILQIFQFSYIKLDEEVEDYPSLLTALKRLTLDVRQVPRHYPTGLSQLTQLTELHILGFHEMNSPYGEIPFTLPKEVLTPLTNLKCLKLDNTKGVTDIHTLTNLTRLDLKYSPGLTQANTDELTKLTDIRHWEPKTFFMKGKGTGIHSNTSYRGEWLNGKRHGYGLCFGKGRWYDGQWLMGHRHGYGKMKFEPGTSVFPSPGGFYKGNWVKGTVTGQGRCVYSNGDIYEGEWKDGRKNGFGKYTKGNQQVEGIWFNDELTGGTKAPSRTAD